MLKEGFPGISQSQLLSLRSSRFLGIYLPMCTCILLARFSSEEGV